MNFISNAFADTAAPAPQIGMMAQLVPFGLIFVVFYFLLIRPQQKKLKEQENLVNSVQKGEEVITQSGIFGKVFEVEEKIVTLEVANNVRIKILKAQIGTVLRGEKKS